MGGSPGGQVTVSGAVVTSLNLPDPDVTRHAQASAMTKNLTSTTRRSRVECLGAKRKSCAMRGLIGTDITPELNDLEPEMIAAIVSDVPSSAC
jgi:hypothetical protein